MTHYAIIEQYGIQKNGSQSEIYDKDVTGHVCVYKRTYRLGREFDACIEEACAALSGVAKDLPKVLVISAHGHDGSGDLEIPGQKDDGDEESICLWQHANAFQPIPDQTVVHLSSCYGAYPAFGKRTGLDLRLADTGNYQILYIAGQHQMEDTGRRVATMLGANGGYLDARGNFVGSVGQWSLPAAKLIDGPVRDADPGTVALLLQKPSNN